MHRRSTFALAFVVPLLAACSASSSLAPASPSALSTTAVVTAQPTVTTSPSSSPVPTPSPTATSSEAGTPTLPNGSIPVGDYTVTFGGITNTFTIDTPGWKGRTHLDGWSVEPPDVRGAVSMTSFGGSVFIDPCSSTGTKVIEATPSSFIDFIAANKHLHAAKPTKVELAGGDAIQLDVTADVTPACSSGPEISLWVFRVPVGDFHLNQGQAARFIAVDVGGRTIVLSIETLDGGDQAKLLAGSKSILDSLKVR